MKFGIRNSEVKIQNFEIENRNDKVVSKWKASQMGYGTVPKTLQKSISFDDCD